MQRGRDILLVDRDAKQQVHFQDIFRRRGRRHVVHHAGDGVEASCFLRQSDRFAMSPRPDLILLNLDLPGKGGLNFLRELKEDRMLRRIPTVVFDGSPDHVDVRRTYELFANCCVIQPKDEESWLKVLTSIENFWLNIVELPP